MNTIKFEINYDFINEWPKENDNKKDLKSTMNEIITKDLNLELEKYYDGWDTSYDHQYFYFTNVPYTLTEQIQTKFDDYKPSFLKMQILITDI